MEAIVFIPGLLSNEILWTNVIANLPAHYHYFIADITHESSIEAMAASVIKQLASEKIINCCLVGFSLGAWVAMAIYQQQPALVKQLVLLNSTSGTLKPQTRISMQDTISEIKQGKFNEYIERLFPLYVNSLHATDQILKQRMLQMMQAVGEKTALQQLKALLDFHGPFKYIEKIQPPTLIVAGKQDQRVDINDQREMTNRINNAELLIIDDAAHFLPLENPVAFASHFLKWLSKQS